jgi:hypothetical protein
MSTTGNSIYEIEQMYTFLQCHDPTLNAARFRCLSVRFRLCEGPTIRITQPTCSATIPDQRRTSTLDESGQARGGLVRKEVLGKYKCILEVSLTSTLAWSWRLWHAFRTL